MKCLLISNITTKSYFDAIAKENACNMKYEYLDFELLYEMPDSYFESQDYIILWLNYATLYRDNTTIYNNLDSILRLAKTKLDCFVAKKIYVTFEDFSLYHEMFMGGIIKPNHINEIFYQEIFQDEIVLNIDYIIASLGLKNSMNPITNYRWNIPYTYDFFQEMYHQINKQIDIDTGKSRKCLVLDCDNVLWGGILSEDGMDKISIAKTGVGRAYLEFQQYVLELYKRGIIITLCTKNNYDDIEDVLNHHDEMVIKKEHISCIMANWNNKADNMIEISKRLNIGLDSMVFIDDSEYEINLVQSMLPEVECVLFDVYKIYEKLSCFNIKRHYNNKSIEDRNNTYRTDEERRNLRRNCTSFEEYLRELKVNVTIHKARDVEFERLAELSQRTNKMTNGMRYSHSEILDKAKNKGYSFYSVYVSDIYCDLGLVGGFGMIDHKLEWFALSCRALGRKVEETILRYIREERVIQKIVFISTNKNEEVNTMLNTLLEEQ